MPDHHRRDGERRNARPPWPATFSRALALAVTLAIHLLGLAMLTRPGAPMPTLTGALSSPDDALEVRWIPPPALPATAHPSTRLPPPARWKAPATHTTSGPPAARITSERIAAKSLQLTLPVTPPSGYIAGGGALAEGLPSVHREARLPGQDAVAHAPVFRMVDPRTRGAAGLVRLLGALTGAIDPRCIELAKWQNLSLLERAARHITDKAMADTEREHGCMAPPARVGPGIDPLIVR